MSAQQNGLDEFGAGIPDDLPDIVRFARANSDRLDTRAGTGLEPKKSREDTCDECNRRITRGTDGTEFGHSRGTRSSDQDRCSNRPAGVDPTKPDGVFDGGAD